MGIDSWATGRIRVEENQINCHGHKALHSIIDDHVLITQAAAHELIHDSLSSYKSKKDVFKFDNKGEEEDDEEKAVCVTSAASYLGVAIIKQLLAMGYSVCALLDNQDDEERLREMGIISGEERQGGDDKRRRVEMKWVSLTQKDGFGERISLYDAFNGYRAVFHTSSFVDPSGLSGYSKSMAELEVKATVNVINTCAMVPSVTKCVLTSSLASCIWQDEISSANRLIDHNSWSQESTCINKKLWFPLGKLRAEKEAWKIAQETNLKLATICPALITGPDYHHKNPTPTIAYLKGCGEMYEKGVLATVDVTRLAKAHVYVYKAMNKNAGGRFICFDRDIRSEDEARKVSEETGVTINTDGASTRMQHQLSDAKLKKIMFSRSNTCYTNYHDRL